MCNPYSRIAIYGATYGRAEYESLQCAQPNGSPSRQEHVERKLNWEDSSQVHTSGFFREVPLNHFVSLSSRQIQNWWKTWKQRKKTRDWEESRRHNKQWISNFDIIPPQRNRFRSFFNKNSNFLFFLIFSPLLTTTAACSSSHTTSTVMKICHGQRKCILTADSTTFGNPCKPETRMYLKVVYTCGEFECSVEWAD